LQLGGDALLRVDQLALELGEIAAHRGDALDLRRGEPLHHAVLGALDVARSAREDRLALWRARHIGWRRRRYQRRREGLVHALYGTGVAAAVVAKL
jgi:hypothetical protein